MSEVTQKMLERRAKYHEVMFGDKDAMVYKNKDGSLTLKYGDHEISLSERDYARGFNTFIGEYAQMEVPKKKEAPEVYRAIVCGKYITGLTLDEVVGKSLKRLDKRGCLDELVQKSRAKEAIFEKIDELLSDIEE